MCFTIINIAAAGHFVHVSFLRVAGVSGDQSSSSGIAGPASLCICNSDRCYQIVHRGILPVCTSFLIPLPARVLASLRVVAKLIGEKWYFCIILLRIFLMNQVKCVFLCCKTRLYFLFYELSPLPSTLFDFLSFSYWLYKGNWCIHFYYKTTPSSS